MRECFEDNTNITTPTIKSIATSSVADDAIVECIAACQASSLCEYWTLDLQEQKCELKESNYENVHSWNSISGEKFCNVEANCTSTETTDFWCDWDYCDPIVTITGDFCSDRFTL